MATTHTDEYRDGYTAFENGVNRHGNPYAYGRMAFGLGSWERDWNEGWDDAEAANGRGEEA